MAEPKPVPAKKPGTKKKRKVVLPSKLVGIFQGYGGPASPSMGGDGYEAGPTDSGEYVIMGTWKHRSTRYPTWSSIPWGAGIQKDAAGILQVHVDGSWRALSSFSSVTEDQIKARYLELYGEAKVPDSWVFNDFGHVTAFMYIDKNRNSKFDKDSEKVHGEFFHTTPDNEAQVARGLPVVMAESHGCIHMHPTEFDQMIARGYFKRGVVVHIHPYTKDAPAPPLDPSGKAPFTVHFFPKSHSVLVFGR